MLHWIKIVLIRKCDFNTNIILNKSLSIQDIIDNTPCRNPYEMTEDQLINELTERGKDTKGSREQLLERLVNLDNCNVSSFLFLL